MLRLDNDYFYLLQFVEKPLTELSLNNKEQAEKWLTAFGTAENNLDQKFSRNSLLLHLITALNEKSVRFHEIFKNEPPQNLNDAMTITHEVLDQTPEWLDRLLEEQSQKIHVGGPNFETYLSTKLFEDGRGACAYLALSVKHKCDSTAWGSPVSGLLNMRAERAFKKEFEEQDEPQKEEDDPREGEDEPQEDEDGPQEDEDGPQEDDDEPVNIDEEMKRRRIL